MKKMTQNDVDVRGKRVLVREDFNVPIDEAGGITDDRRIQAALPTIRNLLARGAAAILVSHLGRPDGKVDPILRMGRVAARLQDLLGRPVATVGYAVGPEADAAARALRPGGVLLLENVRFHAEEEANDPEFARKLASLADLYVNDAFGTAHRAHASTEGVAHHLPAVAGLLMEREVDYLGRMLESPERPFVAILGGKKVSDKIGVIENLLPKVDALLIGGGMAYTFLKAQGKEIGKSLLDTKHLDLARQTLADAERCGVPLILPVDVVVARDFKPDAVYKVVPVDAIPPDWEGLDIGPETVRQFGERLHGAKTVVWNGPLGVFEFPAFAQGTKSVAEAVASCGGLTILGGGDIAAAAEQLGFAGRISHISTGGGASLEFLEGKALPGVAALQDKKGT